MITKLVYTSLVLFILYALMLALGSNQKYPEKVYYNNFFPYLADKPLSEDGYLTLTVAWNIAEGKGITYNFNRHTTGIQPFSGFIFAAIAKVVIAAGGDKIDFVRVIIIFSMLIEVLFFVVIMRISRKLSPGIENKWLYLSSVIFTLLNFELLVYFTNGLETGIYLVCVGVSLLYSINYFRYEKKIYQSVALGAVFGICSLARIDFFVVVAALLLINLYKRRLSITQCFTVGITSVVIIAPWILYIYKTTGSLMQSSARAETSWMNNENFLMRIKAMSFAIMQHMTPNITTGNKDNALIVVFIITVVIVYKYLYNKKILSQFDKDNIKIFGTWSIGILLLLCTYLLYSTAYYFYIRYIAPLLLIILPLLTVLLAVKLKELSKKTIQFGYLLVAIAFLVQAFLYFHSGRLAEQQSLRMAYLKNHFNNKAIVGCFQSGVTGYYDSNVYNLDGKMDHVVKKYIASGNLARFIDSTGINVIIDWNEIVNAFDVNCLKNNYLKNYWTVYSNDIGDSHTVCLIRKNISANILTGK